MAMIDYGAIAFKNGRLISTEMFTPMIDMVGWEDTDQDVYESRAHYVGEPESNYMLPLRLKGNFYAYIGDRDCTIAFYKEQIVIAQRYSDGSWDRTHEYFNCTHYTWLKWTDYVGDAFSDKLTITKRNGYLVCRWKYRGDRYKVYFGYGVDLSYYRKWRCVNYFRSAKYLIHSARRSIKDAIYEYNLRKYF